MRERVKGLLLTLGYGLFLGTLMGASCIFFLRVVYGIHLVPCQFDSKACQVSTYLPSVPMPYVDLPDLDRGIGVSPFTSRLILATLKASREA